MPIDILNLLQALLLPLALGTVVIAALLVWLVGRRPAARRRPLPAPADDHPAVDGSASPAWQPPAAIAPLPALQLPPVPPAAPADNLVQAPRTAAPTPTTPPAALGSTATPPSARPRKADLLLVDDSAVVRTRLRRLFQPAGYSLAMAADGEAALTLLAEGRYGLLLTDLEMPRLDGMGLIRAVMADPVHAGMPMLAITGHDDLQLQLNQLHAVAGIYRKPWVDDDLLGHVQALVAPSLLAELSAEEA